MVGEEGVALSFGINRLNQGAGIFGPLTLKGYFQGHPHRPARFDSSPNGMLKTVMIAAALACLASPAAASSPPRAGSVVAHPSGCPARAFCGCGAAVHIFGHPVRALWLAANWLRFPRSTPAPGMAAVRRHHVFVLESHLSGNTWLAYDANSGRHLTRLHPRSIAGYTIVDPRKAGSV